jgi:hypothetical protein
MRVGANSNTALRTEMLKFERWIRRADLIDVLGASGGGLRLVE